jgi:hypothetical protein
MPPVINWVERKFQVEQVLKQREQVLKEKATDLWDDARSAIQDCCNSFRRRYDEGLEDKLENGLRIRIIRSFMVDHPLTTGTLKRRILAAFNETVPCIEVTVDDEIPIQFKIDADTSRAFITNEGREITADEFSEMALKRALCTPPEPSRAKGPATPEL